MPISHGDPGRGGPMSGRRAGPPPVFGGRAHQAHIPDIRAWPTPSSCIFRRFPASTALTHARSAPDRSIEASRDDDGFVNQLDQVLASLLLTMWLVLVEVTLLRTAVAGARFRQRRLQLLLALALGWIPGLAVQGVLGPVTGGSTARSSPRRPRQPSSISSAACVGSTRKASVSSMPRVSPAHRRTTPHPSAIEGSSDGCSERLAAAVQFRVRVRSVLVTACVQVPLSLDTEVRTVGPPRRVRGCRFGADPTG